MKNFHLHLISDSTGETVSSISRAVMAQFDDVEPEEHIWPLIRTKGQLEKVIDKIRENPGIVIYTLINQDLNDMLYKECTNLKVLCISPLSKVVSDIASYLNIDAKAYVGRGHEINESYYERVSAINFAIAHDDGQSTSNLEEADIVLVGVSRTSKSPTSVYLAYRGFKTANIPFVRGTGLPDKLFDLKKPLIVGLTISPERLTQIRKSRLLALLEEKETSYVNLDDIKEEIAESRKLFLKHGWPVIDVTRKSVEEAAAQIIQYYNEKKNK